MLSLIVSIYMRDQAVSGENNTHLNPEMNDLNEYKSTILKLLKG